MSSTTLAIHSELEFGGKFTEESGTVVGREYLARFPKSAGRFILDAITTKNQVRSSGGLQVRFPRVLTSDCSQHCSK
jgi:hypothetical protein